MCFDTASSLGVLQIIRQVEDFNAQAIMDKFPKLFDGAIGKMKDFQLEIPIDKTVMPIVQSPGEYHTH